MIRYEEDWSFLPKAKGEADPFDRLKWIPLNKSGTLRLTLGGETRQRFERFNNEDWGVEKPGGEGFLLQRYMVHADLHLESGMRAFVQLKSNLVVGRELGPRPTDTDRLDLHQAFFETPIGSRVKVRLGRQEVALGSSRLVSIREGPNVRLTFDGARLLVDSGKWRFGVLALRPARTKQGIFEDVPDSTQMLWGTNAQRSLWAKSGIDLYYLGLDRKRRRFDAGVGREQRHSIGGRLYRKSKDWDYDFEAVGQFGRFGAGSIRAWTVASNTGYTFEDLALKPRIGIKADIASGDHDPGDRRLGTFNALYPKGNYFSQADVLGPYNLMDVHPSITLEIRRGLAWSTDYDGFWRQSTRDGLYDPPGNLIVRSGNSRARFIGHGVKSGLEWKVDRHLSLEGEYQHLISGSYLRETGPKRSIGFLAIWATYKF